MIRFDAIILAGGRGSRLGGVDKGALTIGGRSLLDGVLEATLAADQVVVVGDGPVPRGVLLTREDPVFGGPAAAVVAGLRALRMPSSTSDPDPSEVRGRVGEPPGPGSPIGGHGMSPAPLVLVVACDLPEAAAGVLLLLGAASRSASCGSVDPDEISATARGAEGGIPGALGAPPADGWCLADEDGRRQWLFGLYRARALERAAMALGNPAGRSMAQLLGGLDLLAVPAPARIIMDIDTHDDVQRWRASN